MGAGPWLEDSTVLLRLGLSLRGPALQRTRLLTSTLEGGTGKLVLALEPRNSTALASYARAASSAVSNVPSHTRLLLPGSLISAAKRPHGRFLTPLYLTSSDSPEPPLAQPASILGLRAGWLPVNVRTVSSIFLSYFYNLPLPLSCVGEGWEESLQTDRQTDRKAGRI